MHDTKSYDYTLFKAPAAGPMDAWPAEEPAALGTIDEMKKRVGEAFPGTLWQCHQDTWFGSWACQERYAEFQLSHDGDDGVQYITMRRAQRSDVEALCRHLDTVAVDSQAMELYSQQTGCWSPAR